MRKWTTKVAFVIFAQLLVNTYAVEDANATIEVFWTERTSAGKIWKSNPDGSDPVAVISNLFFPNELTVDAALGKMYWSQGTSPSTTSATNIRRSSLDGSGIEDVYTGSGSFAGQIAIDPLNSYIYWAEIDNFRIRRADLDGANVTDILTGLTSPVGIALDPTNDRLYFAQGANLGEPASISVADLDGGNPTEIINLGTSISELFLDPLGDELYFVHQLSDGIQHPRSVIKRVGIDGNNLEEIVDGGFLTDWRSIVVDTENEIVFFDEYISGNRSIQRYEMQTESLQKIVDIDGPVGGPTLLNIFHAVPEPSAWMIFVVLAILFPIFQRRHR